MNNDTLGYEVKKANRVIFNAKLPEEYEQNESIFNPVRDNAVRRIFHSAVERAGNDAFLDVGTGTGHILGIANDFFKKVYACDISENLLSQIKHRFPYCHFFAADAENIPLKNETMNFIACYAVLHHILKHDGIFREVYRILKPGGMFYTDHDPNYFFNRFYHFFYKIKYRNKPAFGSEIKDLAEYHNACSSGINPEELKTILKQIGFVNVEITYRMTDRTDWRGVTKIAVTSLKKIAAVIPAKNFFTHFSIVARK